MRKLATVGEWVPLSEHLRIPSGPGIYVLRGPSGLEYVGKASDVRLRLGTHRRSKATTDSYVGKAVAKHGPTAFECCLLIRGLPSILSEIEVLVIAQRKTRAPLGYNLTSGGDGAPGKKLTDEQKRRISEMNKGRVKSEETRRRLREAHTGKKYSAEVRAKISAAGRGRKMSDVARAALALANRDPETIQKRAEANRGQTRSQAAKEKMSEKAKARSFATSLRLADRNRRAIIGWPPDRVSVVEFASGTEAAAVLKISPTSITEYCRGQTRHSGGWTFAYL